MASEMELLLLLLLLLGSQHGSLAENKKTELQWEPLENKHEIGENEFLLCLDTVPWCGESRSFMSDFVNVVKREGLAFPSLQLRYVNTHKGNGPPSLTLFRLGNAYKYAGKLSAEHVLSSLKHAIATDPSDLPLKALHSGKQLQEFADSTDRAFVLLDFCGWTQKKDEIIEDTEKEEWWQSDGFVELSQVENMVGMVAAQRTSPFEEGRSLDDDNTFAKSHTMANTSTKVICIEEDLVQIQPQCLPGDKIVFDAFYRNLTEIASAKFLTPGSTRFGIITSMEVIEDARLVVACSKPWALVSQAHDISRSWRMLTDADQLGAFIASSTVIVDEVDKDLEFLNSKPSVLLYIDRGSYLPEVKDESIKALQIVREAARHYAILYPEDSGKSDNSADFVVGDSNYLVQTRGVSTLSSLLNKRNKGDTFAVQIQAADKEELSKGIEGLLSAHAETILQILLEGSDKSQNAAVVVDKGRDAEELETEALEAASIKETDTALSGNEDVETLPVGDHEAGLSGLRDEIRINIELDSKENIEEVSLGNSFNVDDAAGNLGEQNMNEKRQKAAAHTGSIFFGFFDGESALKESVIGTNTSKPSLVLLFPERRAYYVYPTEVPLAFSTLVDFVDKALSGSLQSTARSGPTPTPLREPVRPPFVNLNFHEVNSIPPVTVNTFSELVLGTNNGLKEKRSSLESTWNRDSLVMFTLPWCGFCKRMELVVGEVHRYFTGYILPSANFCVERQRYGTSAQKIGNFEAPAFFRMDCTSNDCSHVLENISEEEAYPSVVLFPARNKHAPVVYDGAPTVNGIFQFIAAYGTSSTAFRGTPKGPRKGQIQPSSIQIQGNVASDGDTLLESMYPSVRQTSQSEMDITPVCIGVGDILLASDKLATAPVFEKSAVLIISASPDQVMGLIVNKRLEWEQLPSLGSQLKNVRSTYLGHGGPIYEHPKHFYALTRLRDVEGFLEVYAGLFVGGPSATERVFELIEANKLPSGEFWFVAGHCGWSWHQLQEEIAAGYWHVTQYQDGFFQWPAPQLNAVENHL